MPPKPLPHLHKYFEIVRLENEAAKHIQKTWRKYRRIEPWRKAVRSMLGIVKIQKRVRGMLTRKFVAQWYRMRLLIILEVQSRSRKFLCNKYLRPKLKFEWNTVITIQRYSRGFLGRRRYKRKLQEQAAIRIQALWRGCMDRSIADKKWLNQTTIMLQNVVRKKIAMNKFTHRSEIYNNAALKIQRKFRMLLAFRRVGQALYEREMQYRMDYIKMLSNEEEFCQEKIGRIMERVVKNQIKEKAQNLLLSLQKQEEVIYKKEKELVELQRQYEILTPRGLEQGFDVELMKNMSDYREEIAKLKFEHLFEITPKLQEADDILETHVIELEELAGQRNRVSKWRTEEYDERRHINYRRDVTQRIKERRLAVAEEKRKWQVLYFSKDGKPDKKRRPGRPWDPSVYAGPDKETYSSTVGVDLLAFVRKKDDVSANIPPSEKVANTMNQVTLQTYLDQVQLYEQLLQPISNILQKGMGVGMDAIQPEKAGWGPEGAKLAPALQGIGVDGSDIVPLRKLKKDRKQVRDRIVNKLSKFVSLEPGSTMPKSISPDNTDMISVITEDSEHGMGMSPKTPLSPKTMRSTTPMGRTFDTIEELEELDSENGSQGDEITGLKLLKSIRRYWKKAPKKYLPEETSFSLEDFQSKTNKTSSLALILDSELPAVSHSHSSLGSSTSKSSGSGSNTKFSKTYSASQSGLTPILNANKKLSSLATPTPLSPLESPQMNLILSDKEIQQLEERQVRLQFHNRRQDRKNSRRRNNGINWELLDQVDAAKHRFESEKNFVEFYKKF